MHGALTHIRITWTLSSMTPQVPGITPGSPLCPWYFGHSSWKGARHQCNKKISIRIVFFWHIRCGCNFGPEDKFAIVPHDMKTLFRSFHTHTHHTKKKGKKVVPNYECHAPLHEECPKHHGDKGDPRLTPGTCGAIGERAQVILVWVIALGIVNASHPQRLRVTRVRP